MEIKCVNVCKTYKIKKGAFKYKSVEVVKNLNYVIKQGEIIALLGAYNSGKSTLVNMLSGRDIPTSGKIYCDSELNYKKLRDNCGLINDFKERKLLLNESVYNNLSYFGDKLDINEFDREKKIVEFRDALELDEIINKKVNELNKLERIKLNVAITMLKNPFALFIDEALEDIDVIGKSIMLKLFKRINKEFKTTIVIASADVMDIEKICKRVSVIKNGNIIVDDNFESVRAKYLNKKNVSITFNKSYSLPNGDFEIIECNDYFIRIQVDFDRCDFATLISQFDVNNIIDINISSGSLDCL